MARCKGCIHDSVCNRDVGYGYMVCPHYINAADVAPKSEVDKWKEINEQLHKEMSERIIEERKIERKLVAREIFEEIEKAHDACIEIGSRNVGWLKVNKFEQMFAELKKKYTEDGQ